MRILDGYGYGGKINQIRSTEYSYGNDVYLDNAGAPLTPQSLPFEIADRMVGTPVVNPHSKHPMALKTAAVVARVRDRILKSLSADPREFTVVFTSGATAALKLVGEAIHHHSLAYLRDSHSSVVGLRNLSKSYSVFDDLEQAPSFEPGSIVSWPLQSNFSGKRYPGQQWTAEVAAQGCYSLLDLASYCATSFPDLGKIKPDLAVISFYKIYGMPDLGALIIRHNPRNKKLLAERKYAGGGTMAVVTPEMRFMIRNSDLAASLEDGSLPVHQILSLEVAMNYFDRIYGPMSNISDHTAAVTRYCIKKIRELDTCTVYSEPGNGPIVALNVNGVGCGHFAAIASELNIHVRTGTLCNVGAFTQISGVSDEQIKDNHLLHGKTCDDGQDFLNGKITGVVRVSFGPYSTIEDVHALVDCIQRYFTVPVRSSEQKETALARSESVRLARISQLITYPIKSCAGVHLESSSVSPAGLEWDRAFCLAHPTSGKLFSLKRHRKMALIKPSIDIHKRVLLVAYQCSAIEIPLDPERWSQRSASHDDEDISACKETPIVSNLDPSVIRFFSDILESPATLAKILDEDQKHQKLNPSPSERARLSLSNSSPLLLVSSQSARAIGDVDPSVFRANIVVEASTPFEEDLWTYVTAGSANFDLYGKCQRCNMICVTPKGESDPRPYQALMHHRRVDGKLFFGRHMGLAGSELTHLEVGTVLKCHLDAA